MKSLRKIPVTVITGFLGAGKTTLLRNLLANPGGRRLALIINEFGDVGVDREILAGCGCDPAGIIELANGCLCCTVADDFLPAVEGLLAHDPAPDHILVETSGLALPKPLVKALAWPDIRARVTVDGVVAVIDGPAFATGRFMDTAPPDVPDHENPLEEVFVDQLACCDLAILNKSDLLDETTSARLAFELKAKLRPGVHFLATSHGAVDVDVLLGISAAAEDDLAARPSLHDAMDGHDHDDFDSFILELPGPVDPEALEARLAQVVETFDILRIKGFFHLLGKPMRGVIQGVGPRFTRYFDRAWKQDEDRRSRLVIIGLKGIDQEAVKAAILG
jgi:cobalamin biosynthesis protein CobW